MTRRRSGVRVAYRPPQLSLQSHRTEPPSSGVDLGSVAMMRFALALAFAAFAGYHPPMIAELPSWMDAQFLRSLSGSLVVVAVLLALILMFVVRSVGTRLVAIILLGAAVFGLVHYRQTLERCDKIGCE